jgi:predicted nuclease with RNAse H fold
MTSKKRHEGYLLIDNRCAGFGMTENATYTCSHCDAVVVMNPLRTRERGYCRGCDKYICDNCNVIRARTFECRPMQRVIDEVLTAAEKNNNKKEF